MAIKVGSGIARNGLIFALDPADATQYTLSEVEVLVVAGGGGGSGGWGNGGGSGGGGGGGVLYSSVYPVTPGSAITVTVGSGGVRGVGSTQAGRTSANAGGKGGNSVFGILTAIGGGGGSGDGTTASTINGGSGGGGGYVGQKQGGLGTAGQGNNGGNHSTQPTDPGWYGGGGGGGAGTPGRNGFALNRTISYTRGGDGGDGLGFWISGSYKVYGGGGGGSSYAYGLGGQGGAGGGGNGGDGNVAPGTPGVDGTNGLGGGGGAGGDPSASGNTGGNGGKGGDGVVIVRYPGARKANGGDHIISADGYTVHTFYTSGTFTPLSAPSNGSTIYGLDNLISPALGCAISYGTPTYSTDGGGSLSITGATQTLRVTKPYPNPIGLYTWEIWFKLTAFGSGGGAVLFHKPNNYTLRILTTDTYQWADGSVYSYAQYGTRTATGIGTLNVWKQLLLTKDSANDVRVYINGSLADTRTGFGFPLPSNPNQSCVLWGYNDTETFRGDFNANGFLSLVRMYDRPLTATEVANNFNVNRARFGI